jgi:hypothetical protein
VLLRIPAAVVVELPHLAAALQPAAQPDTEEVAQLTVPAKLDTDTDTRHATCHSDNSADDGNDHARQRVQHRHDTDSDLPSQDEIPVDIGPPKHPDERTVATDTGHATLRHEFPVEIHDDLRSADEFPIETEAENGQ